YQGGDRRLQARDRGQSVVSAGAPRPGRYPMGERRPRGGDARLRRHRRPLSGGGAPGVVQPAGRERRPRTCRYAEAGAHAHARRRRVQPMKGLRAAHALPLCGAVSACEGRPRSALARGEASHDEPRTGPSVAVLDLSDGAPEQPQGGLLGLSAKGVSLALAARGCKRVWIAPASSVDAIGIAAQTIYFHKLLTEEIGLDIDFLQVGKFKGAEEPFTRDGPSPEARQSLESTLADLRAGWLDAFAKGRPGAAQSAPEDGPYTPEKAREAGLVDEVGYFDQARSALEATAGAVRWDARLGPGAQSGSSDTIADVLKTIAGDSLGAAPVALVVASGAITLEGGSGPLGGSGGISERRLIRTLLRLEHDDDVKAIVLRIDSPGGSALASDLLWHELMAIRHKKTLVVSVGDMAASGGYYLASTGAVIFADATSIVGSIGVVGGKISGGRLLERLGVHAETFPAKTGDPLAAARAASESVLSPWDDA